MFGIHLMGGATVVEDEGITHRHVDAGGIRLHVVEAGSGPVVVLLHGFPDFWYGWRMQIPALVAAGFRVVAPDLPGYGGSESPREAGGWTVRGLAATIAALIEGITDERVVLVGHDWGGALAWRLAAARPDLVRRLVILNAPHPRVFVRLLRTTTQLFRSWYVFFFQLPWLPERVLARRRFAALKGALRRGSRPGAFTREDLSRYVEAWYRPGALSAMLGYYRRGWRRPPRAPGGVRGPRTVTVPTLVIWGEGDPYLDARNVDGLDAWVAELVVERLPDAGHWAQLDEAARVNELIVAFARG